MNLEQPEPYEIETATTFYRIETAFLWAVLKAWVTRKPLTIRNPHTTLTMSAE